ncbi:MAG: hypothetical protein BEN19_07765 [Epulopiscium sp. Nuni2H_MBin003]|nr:MAG: hypothetical protein BEN19_07765 [Epulopiscium sp. Nuni2H_MBin003]
MREYSTLDIERSIYNFQSVILSDSTLRVKLVYQTTVYGVKLVGWQETSLTFELRKNNIILDTSKPYSVNFLTSNSTFLTNIELINTIPKQDVIVCQAKIISPLHQKRERNYFRQKASVPVVLAIIQDKAQKGKSEPIKGVTIDISAGGLKFTSLSKIEPPVNVFVNFMFNNAQLTLKGTVLENFDVIDTSQYIYRVAFKDVDVATFKALEKNIEEFGSKKRQR